VYQATFSPLIAFLSQPDCGPLLSKGAENAVYLSTGKLPMATSPIR